MVTDRRDIEMLLEEIRVGNECIYLVEQQETLHVKDSIRDCFLSNKKILTVGDGGGNIPEEKKSAKKLLMQKVQR